MSHSVRSRVVASLLALLFVGGMGGASDLDAMLFHLHRAAAAPAGAAQLEAANGAGSHAERCVLTLRLASGPVAPRLDLPIRFEGIPQHDAVQRPDAAPRAAAPDHQQQPRAPPAPIA